MAMTILGLVFAFVFGAFLGSFGHTLAIRLKDRSVFWGRPHCEHCQAALKPHHVVPIVSWIALGGRCAFCKRAIRIQYPLAEAAGILLVVIAFVRHPFFLDPAQTGLFFFEALLSFALLTITIFDLRWQLLPIEFIVGVGAVFGVWNIATGHVGFVSAIIGLLVGSLFLAAQAVISRGRWLGWGDPWLGGALGLIVGWPGIAFVLYAACLAGGLVAMAFLLIRRQKPHVRIPYAPILAFGTFVTLWYGSWFESLVRMVWS